MHSSIQKERTEDMNQHQYVCHKVGVVTSAAPPSASKIKIYRCYK